MGWQAHRHAAHPPAEEIARQISQRLTFPNQVDAMTQAVGVEGRGDVITYKYSVAASLINLGGREQVQRKLEGQWFSAACKSKDFQMIFRGGYTLQVRYSFKDSTDAVLISMPPSLCGR